MFCGSAHLCIWSGNCTSKLEKVVFVIAAKKTLNMKAIMKMKMILHYLGANAFT